MEQIQKPEARSPWSRGPAETTGVLKIFFGYAAGVGKTYAMLEAAHQAQKEGIDVVAGYIEPHARPDTWHCWRGLRRSLRQRSTTGGSGCGSSTWTGASTEAPADPGG